MENGTPDTIFRRHEPCDECDSSDACAVYDDHSYCFSCGAWKPRGEQAVTKKKPSNLLDHTPMALEVRGILKETCVALGYGVGTHNGVTVQVADYCDDQGNVVAQKVRYPDKRFECLGDPKQMGLWGAHRFRNDKGKFITICEGEIDCLAMSQLLQNKRPVVSIPNGAPSAPRAIARAIEQLECYERVVFCFDADTAGRKAAVECASILTPGKARIVNMPKDAKDVCEAVQKGYREELITAWWEAKVYRPDGILTVDDLCDLIADETETPSVCYPYPSLQSLLRGLRWGEIVVISSGTGMGKSQLCRGLAAHIVQEGYKVGYIGLEERAQQTALGLLGQVMEKPLHLDRTESSTEEMVAVMKDVFEDKLVVLKHDPSGGLQNLLGRIKYMRVAENVDFVVLDHLHMLVAAAAVGQERQFIDQTMAELRSLIESCGVGLILVSHLRKVQGGPAHEEGTAISIADLRGSGSISQYADAVVFLEVMDRDNDPNVRRLRVVKNRYSGACGVADTLRYDPDTGCLSVTDVNLEEVLVPF